MPLVAERAPDGFKATHQHVAPRRNVGYEPLSESEEEVEIHASKRA